MPARDLTTIVLDADLDAWDRQPGESPRRFAQFATYRDLGRARTLTKVCDSLTLSPGYVRLLAAAGLWTARAEAFDRHRDELHQRAWLDERRRVADNDARLLAVVVGKLAERLRTLEPDELTPADLARLLDTVLKHRRALFGEPAQVAVTLSASADPFAAQLAGFVELGAEARRKAIAEAQEQLARRAAAVAGADDDPD